MNIDIALAATGAVATVLGSAAAARWAGKASVKAAKITVDAQAYTRAKEVYESALSTQRSEVADLRTDVADALAKIEAQGVEISSLRHQVVRYEGRVDQLEGTLRRHRIPVPAWGSPSNLALVSDEFEDPNKPEPLRE